MKLRFILGLSMAFVFWCTNVFAKITVCESLVVRPVEKRAQKLLPPPERSLEEYAATLAPTDLLERLSEGKLWIDLGGQTAKATSQARALYPNLATVNADLNTESYSRRQFQGASVITDIGYAMSRTAHPDLILTRINEWLAPGGIAYVTVDKQSFVRVGPRTIPLLDWLINRSGASCRPLSDHAVECGKRGRMELRKLELISFKEGRRIFGEGDAEDAEPNVAFDVLDPDGKKVGMFDANLSADGEVMTELFFLMDVKGQGYSKEIAREISVRYPKVHELRGVLIIDNRKKYDDKIKEGFKPEEAIKETAFYRTFKPYGFLDVEFTRTISDEIKVIVRKGPDRVVFHDER